MAETTVPVRNEEQSLELTREDSRYLSPPVDIYETEDSLVVVADVPGASQDSVNIRVEEGILTIEAKPCYEPRENPYIEEFGLVTFHRQFQLPDAVDQEKIEAQYRHGVLTITLPKAEAAKPKRIAVKVG